MVVVIDNDFIIVASIEPRIIAGGVKRDVTLCAGCVVQFIDLTFLVTTCLCWDCSIHMNTMFF